MQHPHNTSAAAEDQLGPWAGNLLTSCSFKIAEDSLACS